MGNSMTIAEDLAMGAQTTLLGLLVVFICLALIIVIMMAMSALLRDHAKKEVDAKTTKALPKVPTVTIHDDELLAVLTAAVAAVMECEEPGSPSTPFIVRSYQKTNGRNAWSKAGKDSQITNW